MGILVFCRVWASVNGPIVSSVEVKVEDFSRIEINLIAGNLQENENVTPALQSDCLFSLVEWVHVFLLEGYSHNRDVTVTRGVIRKHV